VFNRDLYYYFYPQVEIIKYINSDTPSVAVPRYEGSNSNESEPISSYFVNAVAEEILLAFDGRRTLAEIVKDFALKYGDKESEIESKVVSVLEHIESTNIFRIVRTKTPESHEIIVTSKDTAYPIRASIELTTKCNMECRHCYGSWGNSKADNIINMDLSKLDGLLCELKSMGVSGVEFTGGEISTYPYVSEAIDMAFRHGIDSVMLLTNGAYLSDNLFNTILKHKHKIHVQVDLHSLNPSYYEWFTGMPDVTKRVTKNIKKLTRAGVKTAVGSIITPGNRDELLSIVKWAQKNKAYAITPTLAIEMGRAKTQNREELFFDDPKQAMGFINELVSLEEKFPRFFRKGNKPDGVLHKNCGLLYSHITIAASGEIKLCTMDISTKYQFSLGNVFRDNIREILNNNKIFVDILRNLEPPNEDTCSIECPHYLFCSNCIVRGLHRAYELEDECTWFNRQPQEFKKHIHTKVL